MIVLVDSDVLIEISRGRDDGVISKWGDLGKSEEVILCSPVSLAELWQGARPSEHRALTNLFDSLLCVPITLCTGRRAGELMRRYRKSHSLELGDAFIAAAAMEHGAALCTRNRKHYPMPGLFFY